VTVDNVVVLQLLEIVVVVAVVLLLLLLVADLVRHIHVRLYLGGNLRFLLVLYFYEKVASDDDNSCYSRPIETME
jgi:hypothetical protein